MRRPKIVLPPNKKLSLKNDGELELFFIGVGSALAEKLNQTNFLIIKGDTHILVDFGETGHHALVQTSGLDLNDIRIILPTHSHPDHANGIGSLAIANRYIGIPFMQNPKLRMIITEEYQRELWDKTLRGGLERNEEENENGRHLCFGNYFEVIRPRWKTFQPREIFESEISEIHLEIFRTKHTPDSSASWEVSYLSYGLFIDGRVFISCDTRFDPELIEMYANRSEFMFHDVQFFPGGVHAPLSDLRTLPPEVKEKMFLMHYADNYQEQDIADFAGWTPQGERIIFD